MGAHVRSGLSEGHTGGAVKPIRTTRLTRAVDYACAAEGDASACSLWPAGARPPRRSTGHQRTLSFTVAVLPV